MSHTSQKSNTFDKFTEDLQQGQSYLRKYRDNYKILEIFILSKIFVKAIRFLIYVGIFLLNSNKFSDFMKKNLSIKSATLSGLMLISHQFVRESTRTK